MPDNSEYPVPDTLALIAGSGQYPFEVMRGARKAGVKRVVVVAFKENTSKDLTKLADEVIWLRVGELGGLLKFLSQTTSSHAVMAGQIHPGHIFNLFPDIKGLMLLAKLRARNAATIFGAISNEMSKIGCELLPAYAFVEENLAKYGSIAGPRPTDRQLDDAYYAFEIAKKISELNIGQTVVVRNGVILAIEASEGSDAAIARGGALGRHQGVAAKVSKPGQDLRFDLPVIGPITVENAHQAGVRMLAVEADITMILESNKTRALALEHRITIHGIRASDVAAYKPLHRRRRAS